MVDVVIVVARILEAIKLRSQDAGMDKTIHSRQNEMTVLTR